MQQTISDERLGKLVEKEFQQATDDINVLPLVTVSTQCLRVLQLKQMSISKWHDPQHCISGISQSSHQALLINTHITIIY